MDAAAVDNHLPRQSQGNAPLCPMQIPADSTPPQTAERRAVVNIALTFGDLLAIAAVAAIVVMAALGSLARVGLLPARRDPGGFC